MGESEISYDLPLNRESLEIRDYQIQIANKCYNKNSLVVLPTGLGKTIIAVLVACKILNIVPPKSKIIVLAPTRPLINQHYETFLKYLNISENLYSVLTGKINPDQREIIFQEKEILFYTPQTLRNDLVNEKYMLKDTALIIFDEAHHSSGDYPYTMISDIFMDHNPDGVILGLTASPGSSKKKITTLCESLHIPVENIHIRTRKDEDVKLYLKQTDIYKIGVKLTDLMKDVYQVLTMVLEERLHYLSQLKFLEVTGDQLYKKVIRKDLLRLNSELVNLLKSNGDKTGIYSALSINAQALIVYHMLELIEQQGLNILLEYLEKLKKDARKKSSSKATKILAADLRLFRIHLELKKNAELSPSNLIHPKFPILVNIIREELKHNPSSRIIVFVKLRNSVKNIVKKLKDYDDIEPVRFVGQASKGKNDRGLSQKQQIEILNEFRKGIYNTLVGTNVAEEGLDIAECDLVIFYDIVGSEIRYIQRKGRTARHREGKVIILYSRGTRDEIYLRIVLAKLKKMNINLKQPQKLRESYKNKEKPFTIDDSNFFSGELSENKAQKIYYQKSKNKGRYQSCLSEFLEQPIKIEKRIEVNKSFPMKFGLRKKLQEDGIKINVVDCDIHIFIYDKIIIQIYNPREIKLDDLKIDIENFKQKSSLSILVFDFIDFEEEISGEKMLLKSKLQEIGKFYSTQIISIDNEEELYFIVKNIVKTSEEK
ncbi:MAG: DEAD/DEAH box helicase [Candidatus Thorarchaeota archaeon]